VSYSEWGLLVNIVFSTLSLVIIKSSSTLHLQVRLNVEADADNNDDKQNLDPLSQI
jgi:hypothetical protein